jgi:excisionase family DNA binding protein
MTTKLTEAVEKRASVIEDGFADVGEAAEYLGLSRAFVYRLMDSGDLEYAKFGCARRIPWQALRAYAERCLVAGR